MMLTASQVQEHLMVLKIAFHPSSPFAGMINLESAGGLLTLPNSEQHQVRDAMSAELVEMVFGKQGAA